MDHKRENSVNIIGLAGIAAVAGIAISAVENFTFRGEISPIVIVALLLLATASLGIGWGIRAWPSVAAVWFWLPATHVAKHLMGMPDTLHPNTYPSIVALAGFSLIVCCLGFFAGAAVRNAVISSPGPVRS